MELGLIAKKETPVVEGFSLDGIRELYEEILEAQKEVGGIVAYRAKIPAGGGKSFEIDTGNEDTDTAAQKITGVVIFSHKCNARFDENSMGEPPICSSMDGIIGTDRATGEVEGCEHCPYNEYGSSSKGSGKACKNMMRIYMMIEGSAIPLMISLPPTSLRAWQNYRLNVLAARRLKPIEVVTELTLTTETSKSNNKYSVVKPKLVGKLSEEAAKTAQFFALGFNSDSKKPEMSADDYNTVTKPNNSAESENDNA